MTQRGRLARRFRVALAAGVVLGAAFAASGTASGGSPAPAGPDNARTVSCGQVDNGFAPAWLAIRRVVGRTRVLALGTDRRGVPRTPPLTDRGKWQFAWDKADRPGGQRGVVRLNAHTYPRDGSSGSALGNRLLARLRTGARLVVTGHHGERLCYRVVRRVAIRAEGSFAAYYSTTGPSRLAILVCSGKRRGPGDWSHRTIWYAEPISPTQGRA